MKLMIAAVGHRMPGWVDQAFADYAKRMPREMPLELLAVKVEPRTSGKPVAALMAAEAGRLRAALPSRCKRVVLDERGGEVTTRTLADRLETWAGEGDDVAFLIGGPDGLDPALKDEATEALRLSGLTLPHGLVRVMLAEALYRAASLLKGHPYHRE
ncbi:MAG: 23S rRNA (pseudouridine(1915)-N(3))-methyltransferase RlmH [Rhodocyclaceae bacterium]|nr:23S rRNA (pseudouridine(1915)-N(3))-methyltransferase RlmH [Rhodocyclaceae bacterium]MBK6554556.1 23S rRNA (pseudouridine(1915)-N(3))-methyltransferase RlmH [Rhodocyclaceae bacterium]MBK6677508.1 23S rRNA (pseudouridine(1915)-N(3))-methyltransferase RlmH [Rhodocyclaceae bacterium]MBK7813944.1 23S rRNA (pseudouridine(1915)-N(3))-methyltransferase RlmH [Rhodocyclaceae bacterium]MBK9310165.1 23S rRNA (pseudouridine(1915)-N(3))-methyltransferase RlmH [Rhodocyclaceae bacterium]